MQVRCLQIDGCKGTNTICDTSACVEHSTFLSQPKLQIRYAFHFLLRLTLVHVCSTDICPKCTSTHLRCRVTCSLTNPHTNAEIKRLVFSLVSRVILRWDILVCLKWKCCNVFSAVFFVSLEFAFHVSTSLCLELRELNGSHEHTSRQNHKNACMCCPGSACRFFAWKYQVDHLCQQMSAQQAVSARSPVWYSKMSDWLFVSAKRTTRSKILDVGRGGNQKYSVTLQYSACLATTPVVDSRQKQTGQFFCPPQCRLTK